MFQKITILVVKRGKRVYCFYFVGDWSIAFYLLEKKDRRKRRKRKKALVGRQPFVGSIVLKIRVLNPRFYGIFNLV